MLEPGLPDLTYHWTTAPATLRGVTFVLEDIILGDCVVDYSIELSGKC